MRKSILALLLCASILLSACSAQKAYEGPREEANAYQSEDNYGAANYDQEPSDEASGDSDAVKTAKIDPTADDLTDNTNPSQKESNGMDANTTKKDQKLVYRCNMSMETLEYEETIKAIKKQIRNFDGIMEQESETDSDRSWYLSSSRYTASKEAQLIIRIPSEKYNDFLESISGSGKITFKDMQVENITKHYTEVQTDILSLQTQEKRLLEMMEKAKSVDEMITVESRLTEVQNQLAKYKNTLASLDTDVAYSTVNLSVTEVVKYDTPNSTFKDRLFKTLEESKHNFLSFLEGSLFFLILFGPVILVIILVIFVIVKIIKKLRKGSKRKE